MEQVSETLWNLGHLGWISVVLEQDYELWMFLSKKQIVSGSDCGTSV